MLAASSEAGSEDGAKLAARVAAILAAKLAAKLSTHFALHSSFDSLHFVLGVDGLPRRLVARAQLEPGARIVAVFSQVPQVPHHADREGSGGGDEEAEKKKHGERMGR